MDEYETWPVRQLQEACRERGLPTSRAKADMVQRLRDNDVTEPPQVEVIAESDVPPPPVPPVVEPEAPAPAVAGAPVFRHTLPHVHGGLLDDASHLDYRRRTYEAAIAQGLQPRGGELAAHRVGTTTDGEVYEIDLRRPR